MSVDDSSVPIVTRPTRLRLAVWKDRGSDYMVFGWVPGYFTNVHDESLALDAWEALIDSVVLGAEIFLVRAEGQHVVAGCR